MFFIALCQYFLPSSPSKVESTVKAASLIDLPNPLPLYFKIELDLKARIEQGEFMPGERFLTAPEICKAYDVSMITARRAMRSLAEKKYISSVRGRGSMVCSPLPVAPSRFSPSIPTGPVLRLASRTPFTDLFKSPQFRTLLAKRFPDLTLEFVGNIDEDPIESWVHQADVLTPIDSTFRPLRDAGYLAPLCELADPVTLATMKAELLPELPRLLGEAIDYMLPLTCAPIVLIYNRDLLAQGGVVPELGLSTVEEFVTTCRRLKDAFHEKGVRGVSPMLMELNHYRRWPLAIYWNGGKLWSDDGRRCLIESPEAQAAFAWYYKIIFKEQIAVNSFTFTGTLEENLFSKGKLAFHFGSYTTLYNYQHQCQFEYGIARVPAGKKRATLAVHGSAAVCNLSKQKPLAFEFVQFLMTPPVQQLIHQLAHLPSNRETLERWSLEEANPMQRHQLSIIMESLKDAVPLEYPARQELSDQVRQQMSQVWLDLAHAPEICRELSKAIHSQASRPPRMPVSTL